jgi:ABC-type Fe3+ transport system permease subunit
MALLAGALVVVVVAGVAPIGLAAARAVLSNPPDPTEAALAWTWPALARTVIVAALVATLALPAGAAVSALLRSARPGLAALALVPVVLPAWLAYTGFGELRAPLTPLGDFLAAHAQAGRRWVPILAGHAAAVLGLALWTAPIVGVVLAAWSAPRAPLGDELAVDGAGLGRAARVWCRAYAPGLALGWLMAAALTAGSPLPLHLAQIDTIGTAAWRALTETPPERWPEVWRAAWPAGAAAAVAAMVVARAVATPRPEGEVIRWDSARSRGGFSQAALVAGLAVVLLGVLGPVAMLASGVKHWDVIPRFWGGAWDAAAGSALRALGVAAVVSAIGAAVACLLASGRKWARWVAGAACGALVATAVVPGVLVGSAVAASGAVAAGWAEWWAGPMVAHVARFGAVGALAGWWAARCEPGWRVALAQMEGGGGVRAWWGAMGRGQARVLIAAGVAAGALALHEVEATVMVQPPGDGALAQRVLGLLHFQRMEELSAAGLGIVAAAGVLGVVVALVGTGRGRAA